MKVLNPFSLNMLPKNSRCTVEVKPCSIESARKCLPLYGGVESCVGHAETAAIISDLLGIQVPFNRASIQLEDDETVLVAQYVGPRLVEGTTTLPEGAEIAFMYVSVYTTSGC